jgi:hypothetical protein
MFYVCWIGLVEFDGELEERAFGQSFAFERDARKFINERADGSQTYWLYDPDNNLIVAASYGVLMVA